MEGALNPPPKPPHLAPTNLLGVGEKLESWQAILLLKNVRAFSRLKSTKLHRGKSSSGILAQHKINQTPQRKSFFCVGHHDRPGGQGGRGKQQLGKMQGEYGRKMGQQSGKVM